MAIAARRATIAGSENHCDSLSCGLLPERVEELIAGGSNSRFADPVTFANDRRNILVHGKLSGEIDAEGRIRGRRDDELHSGAFGHRAGPLDIQIRLGLIARRDAGIRAVDDKNGVLRGKAEQGLERFDITVDNVALTDDCNSLAGAVICRGRVPKRQHVVDGGEVEGTEPKTRSRGTATTEGKERFRSSHGFYHARGTLLGVNAGDHVHRLTRKIVKRVKPDDNWRERGRNGRIA